ncbi:serine/threonine-protein kinase [Hyalangium versicolor]|uniref:serine/threonine-protein kinase n=1 Tax=Hyalangium versicolor TaxID=2861190 RepID=UPI001CC95F18|nr:serine/threonine-protein kinase [Hyalangium versicolor]
MRKRYEEELRVAQTRGVLSQEEAESLLVEGLRQNCHPLELLVARGVISEETLETIQAEARSAAVHPGEKAQESATVSLRRPAAEPAPRQEAPLTPASPTLTLQPTPRRPSEVSAQEPAFPAPGWERYHPVRFLGQGGMGRVYLAYDPLLRRNVALKFVRGDDPDMLRRFVSEAQAQARVDHERVCKVYEVGEVQGQPFIAMQYVNGRSLLDMIGELSVEQKVMVVQQATEGVHAAHRAGLIHRDLKPSNILVERGEDGRWKPYVMDFGLARDWQRDTTVTGTVLGTPHYMAPEQARGEVSRLDRRADVYSLGATLYVLLTGKAPIPGSNPLEVLNNLATQEPRPLRELDKNIPADLEAIVLKCLEREPSARYDSARALAEDLGRFLNGEPVQARAVGTWYRLRKRARKHWALVSMASVVMVLVALSLGQAVLNRRDTHLRESLARRFAELASDVGARARFMALSRLHDTRAERQALRAKLEEVEKAMQQGGERALGPGHYALGQGWLELGDPAQAREHLEAAWAHDFQDVRVAYALALALGQLYRQQLLSLGSLTAARRKSRRAELEHQYRDPALTWLRLGQGAPVLSPEYMEALLAFYEERYDDALPRLDALGEQLPWFYEAPKLRGDILQMRALTRWDDGNHSQEERARAQADLEQARKAYALAADTAQSWPEAHYGLARVEWAEASMDLYSGGQVQPHIERALEHLARALRAAPDHTESLALQASLYRNLAEARSLQGGDAEAPLDEATQAARRALALKPLHPDARKELGMSLWRLATLRQTKGLDPRAQLREAADVFGSFEPNEKDYYVHHGLGVVFKAWADYEEEIGADSRSHRDQAIDAFKQTLLLEPQYAPGWTNLAVEYYKRAARPHAPGAEEDLEQAWQALQKSRTLNARNPVLSYQEGRLHHLRALRLRDTGGDERPELAAAIASCLEGLAINPRMVALHNLMGRVLQDQARGNWDRGEDPLSFLKQARQSFEQALALDPKLALTYNNLADLEATRAVYLRARGQDPRPNARAALQSAQEAQRQAPEHPFGLIDQGHAHQLLAAFTFEAQGDPTADLTEATEKLQKALERAPRNAEAWLYLAETRAIRARWRARQGQAETKDFEEAAEAYQRSLETTDRPLEYRLAFGRFCGEWAAWRQRARLDLHLALDRGLALASELLAARPKWAEARVLRASLQFLEAGSQANAAPERTRALQELRDVLKANPHLQRTWEEASHWGG